MSEERWERWVRAPQQERARQTFERILSGAAQILVESGYDGFAVAEICRRAGVAPGTLYARIEDRSTLFLAVHDWEMARITLQVEAALAALAATAQSGGSLPTPRLLDRVVDLMADHYADERTLLRVFILRAAVDPRVRDEGSHFVDRLERAALAVLLLRREDFASDDPERAVRVAYRLVVDSLSWRTAFGADLHPDGPLQRLGWARELRTVMRQYLLG